jgi:hypothetical protein
MNVMYKASKNYEHALNNMLKAIYSSVCVCVFVCVCVLYDHNSQLYYE